MFIVSKKKTTNYYTLFNKFNYDKRKFKTFKNEYVFITSRLWYFNQYFSINFWRWCSSLFFTTSISRSTSHQIQFFLGKYIVLFHPDNFSVQSAFLLVFTLSLL